MEYCSGGELFEKLTEKNSSVFSEAQAAEILQKLLHAINHCHSNNIAHRDLKPENIMYSKKGDDAEIKIIDFGLSKKTKTKKSKLATMVGTPYYVAPEVLEGFYSFECDLWSIGVIMYILLSGYLPFSGNTRAEVFERVKSADYNFNQKEWDNVSQNAKDLITEMLTTNRKNRITASAALKHSWFKSAEDAKGEE